MSYRTQCPNKERHPVSRCFFIPARYPYLTECSPVTNNVSCTRLSSVPDFGCHHGTMCFRPQNHFCIQATSCSVSGGLEHKWYMMSCYKRACMRSTWNMCNRKWSRTNQYWLLARKYISTKPTPSIMWRGDQEYRIAILLEDTVLIHLTPLTLHKYINNSSFPGRGSSLEILRKWVRLTTVKDFFAFKRPDFYRQSIAKLEVRRQKFLGIFEVNRITNFLYIFFLKINYKQQVLGYHVELLLEFWVCLCCVFYLSSYYLLKFVSN